MHADIQLDNRRKTILYRKYDSSQTIHGPKYKSLLTYKIFFKEFSITSFINWFCNILLLRHTHMSSPSTVLVKEDETVIKSLGINQYLHRLEERLREQYHAVLTIQTSYNREDK